MLHLRIFKGDAFIEDRSLNSDQVIIGNGGKLGDGHLNLNDESVAQIHAVIKKKLNKYTIYDLSPDSATQHNGKALSAEAELSAGDELLIGAFRIRYSDEPFKARDVVAALAEPKGTFATKSEVADLRPLIRANQGKNIEIIVAWKERVISTHRVAPGQSVSIGNHKKSDIYLPIFDNKDFKHEFLSVGEKTTVYLAPTMMNGELVGGGARQSLKAVAGERTSIRGQSQALDLNHDEMLNLDLAQGNVTLFIRHTGEAAKPASGALIGINKKEALSFGVAVAISAVIALAVSFKVASQAELKKEARRVARFVYAPSHAAAPEQKKGEAKKVAPKSGQSAATVKKDVSKMGVLGIFGANGIRKKLDQAANGEGTLQGMAEKANGGVGENQDSSADAVGQAMNGGAANNNAIGIDGVGTKGKNVGGQALADIAGKNKHQIKLDGKETVTGNIDKEAIRRVIAENIGQIRACYENALNRQPDLSGKLVLEWEIDHDGKPTHAKVVKSSLNSPVVTNCVISRLYSWRFPKPPPGVTGQVDYPFSFESSGQLNGG